MTERIENAVIDTFAPHGCAKWRTVITISMTESGPTPQHAERAATW